MSLDGASTYKMSFLSFLKALSGQTSGTAGGLMVPIYNMPLVSVNLDDDLEIEELETSGRALDTSLVNDVRNAIGDGRRLRLWLAHQTASKLIMHMTRDGRACPIALYVNDHFEAPDPLNLPPLSGLIPRVSILAPNCKKDRLALEFYNDHEYGSRFKYAILFTRDGPERIRPIDYHDCAYDSDSSRSSSSSTLSGMFRSSTSSDVFRFNYSPVGSSCALDHGISWVCPGTVIFKWETCLTSCRMPVPMDVATMLRTYRDRGWKIVIYSDILPTDGAKDSNIELIVESVPKDIDFKIYVNRPGKIRHSSVLHNLLHEIFMFHDGLPVVVYSSDSTELVSASSLGVSEGISIVAVFFNSVTDSHVMYMMREHMRTVNGIIAPLWSLET